MTEHKKIPLPEDGDESKTGKAGESSLFERASGAFGLDSFGSAPMPGKLADAPMKRARPVRRKTVTEQTGPAVTDREPDHGASAARVNDQAAPEKTVSADTETWPRRRPASLPSRRPMPRQRSRHADTEHPSPGSRFPSTETFLRKTA